MDNFHSVLFIFLSLLFFSCSSNDESSEILDVNFKNPIEITITGYNGSAMEPFISYDGKYLFFNNPTEENQSGDIHYAEFSNNEIFVYKGLVQGVNTNKFEGAPSMDASGNFYYTSLNTYPQNFLSIYRGKFNNGSVTNVTAIDQNLTQKQIGKVDMDAVISSNGEKLILAIGTFTTKNYPDESNLIIASKINDTFIKDSNSDEILKNINSDLPEYAASLSSDGLELFFNRSNLPHDFKIMKASRSSINEAFGIPLEIETTSGGIIEGASITSDGKELFYHKKINGQFKIFKVRRN
jgi:hypothetical protein